MHETDATMPCGLDTLVSDLPKHTLFVKRVPTTLCKFESLVGK